MHVLLGHKIHEHFGSSAFIPAAHWFLIVKIPSTTSAVIMYSIFPYASPYHIYLGWCLGLCPPRYDDRQQQWLLQQWWLLGWAVWCVPRLRNRHQPTPGRLPVAAPPPAGSASPGGDDDGAGDVGRVPQQQHKPPPAGQLRWRSDPWVQGSSVEWQTALERQWLL